MLSSLAASAIVCVFGASPVCIRNPFSVTPGRPFLSIGANCWLDLAMIPVIILVAPGEYPHQEHIVTLTIEEGRSKAFAELLLWCASSTSTPSREIQEAGEAWI